VRIELAPALESLARDLALEIRADLTFDSDSESLTLDMVRVSNATQ
jgi:hypothetical protein